jgi:hypothetical protein
LEGNFFSYGLAPKSKLDDAVLRLVRDAHAEPAQLIVMSRDDLTPQVYILGRHLMLNDIRLFPNPSGRRTVTVFRDQRVRIDEAGVTHWTNVRLTAGNASPDLLSSLLTRERHAKEIHVEGIGPVKLLVDATEERAKRDGKL